MELSVVIPVFNGVGFVRASVAALVEYLEANCPSFEVVVVDDGSTDGTAESLAGLADRAVRVLPLEHNVGKYGAIAAGMVACRGRCRVFTDADVPYEHEAIPYIVELVNRRGFHLAVGDRTLQESQYGVHLALPRRVATRAFTFFVTIFVTGGLFDTQCGLKGFRGDVAEALFPLLKDHGFAGDVEVLYVALKHNLEIKRIPVRLRRSAPSTVRLLRDSADMVRCVARLRGNWRKGVYSSPELRALSRQAYWEANTESRTSATGGAEGGRQA